MSTCPSCGKMSGIHGSVLQGCMCQYSMQAPVMREGKDFTISKPWVGLTDEDKAMCIQATSDRGSVDELIAAIEAKLKGKNA